MAKLTLYSYYQSSAAYRVRCALYFKGLDFEYKSVDLTANQQYDEAYSDVNPMNQVPTLVLEDGTVIAQSMAIFLWLDRVYPKKLLFPENANSMARVVQFCENINSGIHPVQNLRVRKDLEKKFGASKEAQAAWSAEVIERGFQSLERILEKTSGKYCFENTITAADMFLVPQVFNARRYRVDLARFPRITSVDQNCMGLDFFKKAHPSAQPDAK